MKIFKEAKAEFYTSDKEIEEIFNSQPKCKISGEVVSTKSIADDNNGPIGCYGDFYIQISNNSKLYNVHGQNLMGDCTGLDPIFSTLKGKNIPKIGDMIYTILNNNSFGVIKYGKEEYDKYSEIPVCESNVIKDEVKETIFNQNTAILSAGIIVFVIIAGLILSKIKIKKKNNGE